MTKKEPSESSTDPKDKKILVVDDEDGIRELVAFVLGEEGFRIETAMDGVEALTALKASPPDLMVLDLMLPRYGGYEILRNLQKGEHADIPIIVMTGRYVEGTMSDMIEKESNVLGFLTKPVKTAELVELVHRILKTKASV